MNKLKISAQPVNKIHGNAIDAVGFNISFAQPLTDSEIEKLTRLQPLFKDDFSEFLKLDIREVPFQKNTIEDNQPKFKGINFRSQTTSAEIAWDLTIREGAVFLTCFQYDRWDLVLPKAINFLTKSLKFVDLEKLLITSINCQILDRFFYEQFPDSYELNDVFNPKSEYLPLSINRTSKIAPFWHAFQGWFEKSPEAHNDPVLNQLKIHSSMFNDKLVAAIEHTAQMTFKNSVTANSLFTNLDTGSSRLEAFFNIAHDSNKLILKDLLSKNKIEEIGLMS